MLFRICLLRSQANIKIIRAAVADLLNSVSNTTADFFVTLNLKVLKCYVKHWYIIWKISLSHVDLHRRQIANFWILLHQVCTFFKPTPQILSKGAILLWNVLISALIPFMLWTSTPCEGINQESETWGPPPSDVVSR